MKYLITFNESIINTNFNDLSYLLGKKIDKSLLKNLSKLDDKIFFISKEDFDSIQSNNSIIGMIGEDDNNNTLIYIIIDTKEHPIFNEITRRLIISTIRHELIHLEQRKRRSFKSIKYNYKNKEDYFKNTDEIMAISYSIVSEIIDFIEIHRHRYYFLGHDKDDYFKTLKSLSSISPSYEFIKNEIGGKILRKYNKYIYQYLKDYVEKIGL
jgi:hypothetical protein